MMGNPGYAVKLSDGRTGRAYHNKGLVNGKIPVYLDKDTVTGKHGHSIAISYREQAILCRKETVTIVGYID